MKKVMKILHSRYFLAAFCIVLEFVQVIGVFVLLYKVFWPVTILGTVFDCGVLLYLINKDESPEFKLPWLMLLLILPVIGAFVFILLSSTENSKEQKRKFEVEERVIGACRRNMDFLQWMNAMEEQNQDPRFYRQAQYLCQASGLSCHKDTDMTYRGREPCGRTGTASPMGDGGGAGGSWLADQKNKNVFYTE